MGTKTKIASVDEIEAMLLDLKIGSGFKPSKITPEFSGGWTLTMYAVRERGEPLSFTIDLSRADVPGVGVLRRRAPVPFERMHTKGRSQWNADNTWRLRPEFAREYATAVAKVIREYDAAAEG